MTNPNIELTRTFYPISDESIDLETYETNITYGLEKSIEWKTVLENKRVVIIAEAGAGKTHELKYLTKKLHRDGKSAFFMRLEHLKDGIETAFDNIRENEFADFQSWKESEEIGYFFLDSVDEAKLGDPRDFEKALKKLNIELSSTLDRTIIVISSRPTFEPISETQLFNQHLPVPPQKKQIIDDEDSQKNTSESKEEKEHKAALYSLTPLNLNQIKQYATEKGVQEIDAFMEALTKSDSENFAGRPRDLNGITQTWLKDKKIGSKLDVIKANIEHRIKEVDSKREQLNPLNKLKAMEGIKMVAAVCTLTSHSRIAVPDKELQTDAISIIEILPDWSRNEQLALLQRPIFDDMAYGLVRFHDRDIREFLTSEWIRDLLERNGSRREIEALFFKTQYGVEAIRPKLREILPWVALFDDQIRERALKISPSTLLGGGDPTHFPTEFKIQVLKSTCEEMRANESLRHSFSDIAIERFSDKHIETTVQELFEKYKHHKGIDDVLLQMIWRGKLTNCKDQARSIALDKEANDYTRIYALRACAAIFSEHDGQQIIEYFVKSKNDTSRRVISALVNNFPEKLLPNDLITILARLPQPNKHSHDSLKYALEDIETITRLPKLETLFAKLATLTFQKPHLEKRYCEVSRQYKWLMKPLGTITEGFVKKRSSAMLTGIGLETLSQLARFRDSGFGDDFKTNLTSLVSSWKKLNNASFWHDVNCARKDKDQVNHFCQIGYYGHFWDLSTIDLEKALQWIDQKEEMDDKLVALSIAFNIYKENQRQPKERQKIKDACKDWKELEQQLHNYLHPPALSDEQKKWRRSDRYYKQKHQKREKQQQANLDSWRKYAAKNIDQVSYVDESGKGATYYIQRFLFDRMRQNDSNSNKWANTEWESLIEDQNKQVAEAFKEFLTNIWKHYAPKLCSEANEYSNSTSHSVIYGLSGLSILEKENNNWASELSQREPELACRYAIQELNGVPSWLERLYELYPDTVLNTFYKEIYWELFEYQGDKPLHYVLDKVVWNCHWIFPQMAPLLFQSLSENELRFEESLEQCLIILMSSPLVTENQLSKMATKKLEANEVSNEHLWFPLLITNSPAEGISKLESFLSSLPDDEATIFSMKFLVSLFGSRRKNAIRNYRRHDTNVEYLYNLYVLMHKYIDAEKDIHRAGTGVYTPQLRDNAQDARDALFRKLKEISGKEAYLALKRLSDKHPYKKAREWMKSYAQEHLENEADLPEWSIQNVHDFALSQEYCPTNPRELFTITINRLNGLKYELEHGEDSVANTWIKQDQEPQLRILIAKWLRDRANSYYSVHQEEEQADGKRPDIRLHSQAFDAPVPVELKISDNWSGNELIERLENQLCNDYLRDFRTNFGVFLLVWRGEKNGWDISERLSFNDLIQHLQHHGKVYTENRGDIENLEIIGIDLTARSVPIRI